MSAPLFTVGVEVHIAGMDQLIDAIRGLAPAEPHHPHLTGGKFVITLKDDTKDGTYAISGLAAVDSEGSAVADAQLAIAVTSTDDTVFSVTPDAADPTTGTYHVGAPGVASVNVVVKSKGNDAILGSFGEQFTVTSGDPSAISTGKISFSDLVEDPAPDAAPVA